MALHGLGTVTIGVPNVAETIAYYTDFGLEYRGDGRFATRDGGEQLRIVAAPARRLIELGVAADDQDDIATIGRRLRAHGVPAEGADAAVRTVEPVTGTGVRVAVRPRIVVRPAVPATPHNGPGRIDRWGRAPFIARTEPVRPRKLGHAVLGSTDLETRMRFFTDGLGFQVSDYMGGKAAFLRCSVEHHNVLMMATPIHFLHHTSWRVDDVDKVGRGAQAMLEGNPERRIWGLGRHYAGANSSNTSRIPPAISLSTTPTWTPSPKTSSRGRAVSRLQEPAARVDCRRLARALQQHHWGGRVRLARVQGLPRPDMLGGAGHHRRRDHDGRRGRGPVSATVHPSLGARSAERRSHLPNGEHLVPRRHRADRQQVPRRRVPGPGVTRKSPPATTTTPSTSASTRDRSLDRTQTGRGRRNTVDRSAFGGPERVRSRMRDRSVAADGVTQSPWRQTPG